MGTRTVTLSQVVEAMEENGYPQGYRHLLKDSRESTLDSYKGQKIVAACAIGQAGLNLGVGLLALAGALHNIKLRTNSKESLFDFIVELNDIKEFPVKEIAVKTRKQYNKIINKSIEVTEVNFSEFDNYQGVKI